MQPTGAVLVRLARTDQPPAACQQSAKGYTVRMTISREQASRLYDALFPHVNFLLRLKKRCDEVLAADDPLRVAAGQAYEAAWRLSREAHSLSYGHGALPSP